MRNKALLLLLGLLIVALFWALATASGTNKTVTAIPVEGAPAAQAPSERAPCAMTKTTGVIANYFGGFEAGMIVITYFNPAVHCTAPIYPFEITDFSFTLYDDGSFIWPAMVDIVVYGLAVPGDSCGGPGAELCRYSLAADQLTYEYPNVGTYAFPTVCCVNGPFYIGLEYTAGAGGSTPSVCFDDNPAPVICDNWFFYQGTWYEWYDIWTPPTPGYPMYWVGGETESPNCPSCNWQPGDAHKMHYPQLPDEAGWDVNATQPLVLADDWMCSDSGWIKDFHFWGSWKDDYVGEIQAFVLSIHNNIPAGGQYGQCFADGDCDNNGIPLSVADMIWLINYVYQGGFPCVPWYSGDLNGDCVVDSRDIIVYQNYFTSGLAAFDPYGGYPVPTCCDSLLYSRPDLTLWELQVTDFDIVPFDPPTMEGWYDPSTGEVLPDNHQAYFQYNICLNESDWFWQELDSIYWLNISAIVATPDHKWGWKSSQDHFMDDAVWAYWGELQWVDIWEPSDPLFNTFWIAIDPAGTVDPNWTGGVGYYDDGMSLNGWYFYEMTEWWNIWFYDHPFTYEREKVVHIEFDVFPYNSEFPSWLTFAVNWSTDIWSLDGQPPGDSMPPLPGVDPESLYIGRDIYLNGEITQGHYSFEWRIPDYNPEWVSIDVQGYNFVIFEGAGMIWHDCQQSLDLSFVVTGGEEEPPPTGACCYSPTGGPNELCIVTTQVDCETNLGGIYQGDGTTCAGMQACCLADGTCVDADALCCVNELGGVPQGPGTVCTAPEACCFADGSCQDLDPVCCIWLGGTPQGPGSQCTALEACCFADGSCQDIDPVCCIWLGGNPQGPGTTCAGMQACCLADGSCIDADALCCVNELGGTPQGPGTQCTALQACCFTDGSCQDLDPVCCLDLGGEPQGPGTVCLGDLNGNNIDDACECDWEPGDPHKMHFPQLPDESGWDVNATMPLVLADDWRCSDTGYVKDIHFWGSWRNGIVGHITSFWLSIHSNIPDPDGPGPAYSMPGATLWEREIFAFGATPIDPPTMEGWYDPATGEILPNDHDSYFQYNVCLEEPDWFWQEEGMIYWLNISAIVEPPGAVWGWKSSQDHFMDDAVWALWGQLDWIDLWEPYAGPKTNAFWIEFDYMGIPINAGGTDYYDDGTSLNGWYYYENTGWWNIWFYDDPFDPQRYKEILVFFEWLPNWVDYSIEVAVNWATPDWPPGQPPPIPPLGPAEEEMYIYREIIPIYEPGPVEFQFTIPDYNPEWVSIDVRGYGFAIPMGEIKHECLPQDTVSLDLAFVITGGEICDCIPGDADGNGMINIADVVYLIAFIFAAGPPPTPYATCSGDADCNCMVNIADVVYLINFIFGGGPAPCTCQQWLAACGPPLY